MALKELQPIRRRSEAGAAERAGDAAYIKGVDVVSVGLRGDNLDELRAHVRLAFVIERAGE